MGSWNAVCSNNFDGCKSFADLSADILLAIFLRLPLESIICCRCVSKSWYSLTHDPLLIKEHMIGEGNKQQLLVQENKELKIVNILLLNIDNKKIRHLPVRDPWLKDFHAMSNCNGLLCLSHHQHDPIVLYNPIAAQRITLPAFQYNLYRCFVRNHEVGVGFDIVSGKYKVVRNYEHNRKRYYYMITVGEDDKWKKIPSPKQMKGVCTIPATVCWNGVMFWPIFFLPYPGCRILAFDLHDKMFQVITFPQSLRPPDSFNLVSLLHVGEYLAVVEYHGSSFRLLKVNGEKIGGYFLSLEREYNTGMELDGCNYYSVVRKLNGDGFLLQVRILGRRGYFAKFLPGATPSCEIIDIPGMDSEYATLFDYKPSLVSPKSI